MYLLLDYFFFILSYSLSTVRLGDSTLNVSSFVQYIILILLFLILGYCKRLLHNKKDFWPAHRYVGKTERPSVPVDGPCYRSALSVCAAWIHRVGCTLWTLLIC